MSAPEGQSTQDAGSVSETTRAGEAGQSGLAEKVGELASQLEEAKSLERANADEIASLVAEVAELKVLVLGPSERGGFGSSGQSGADYIVSQIEALDTLVFEALAEYQLEEIGDEFDARCYAERVGFGVGAFCKSLALQVRRDAESRARALRNE